MPAERGDALTPREVAVVYAVAADHTQKEIAKDLGIAVNTVKVHITAIHRKLNVQSAIGMITVFGLMKLPSADELASLIDLAGLREKLVKIQSDVDEATSRLDELSS